MKGNPRCHPTLILETSAVGPLCPHETKEMEGGGERTWPDASERGREDEVGEAAKEETMPGTKDEIGQDRSQQAMSQPSRRMMQQGLESPKKTNAEKSPPHRFLRLRQSGS